MGKLLKLGVFLVMGIALFLGVRRFLAAQNSVAEGRTFESPDGRYSLVAMGHVGKDFWGRSQRWYELQLVDQNNGMVIDDASMTVRPGEPWADFRYDGKAVWGPGKRRVTLSYGNDVIWRTGM